MAAMWLLVLVLILVVVAIVIALVCGWGWWGGKFGCTSRRRRRGGCCRPIRPPSSSSSSSSASTSTGPVTGGFGGPDLSSMTELVGLEVREINDQNRPGRRPNPRIQMKAADGIEFTASSTNWCGYVQSSSLTAPAAGAINAIGGTWTLPTVVATPGQAATYVACWVGIDGFSDGTVEQLGTEQDVINGVVESYAWFEMYPGGSYEIVGFPVDAGDSITATVTYQSGSQYVMTIVNNTHNVYYTVPATYSRIANGQRSSAEWIVEAPYMNGILPLAHFSTIAFSNCTSNFKGVVGPINACGSQSEPITMVDSSNHIKAQPSSLNSAGNGFTVAWSSST